MQRSVYLATPCYTAFAPQAHVAVLDFIADANAQGISVNHQAWVGDSLLPHARNVLLAHFAQTDCTDLFWWDADVHPERGAALRLLSKPVDLVLGVYRRKHTNEDYPVVFLGEPGSPLFADPETGLLKIKRAALGFCRMSRGCVQRLMEAWKHQPYRHPSWPELRCHCVFNLEYRYAAAPGADGDLMGEDYLVCDRWRDIGGDVWVDPEVKIGHVGSHEFEGHFGDWLRGRMDDATAKRARFAELVGKNDYTKLFRDALGESDDGPFALLGRLASRPDYQMFSHHLVGEQREAA